METARNLRGTARRAGGSRGFALRLLVLAVAVSVSIGLLSSTGAAASSAKQKTTHIYVGLGFDTCTAPSIATLKAWLASPYRALGIYIGGANRACGDGLLSPTWVRRAKALGWNLLPLYVGLQAPCVAQSGLAHITSGAAEAQGIAAADDAASRASYFGLQPGDPIYFDMEGYNAGASCTQAVRSFITAWDNELHVYGYAAGVYGSAASTIRDLIGLTSSGNAPDQVWIANWNGVKKVFGDQYVSDTFWTNHQRVHQFRGGHNERYGGVTLNIDSDYVDGAVVGPGTPLPPPTLPTGGTASTGDGLASVSWPTEAFDTPTGVTLASSTLDADTQGYGADSYLLTLTALDSHSAASVTAFNAPLVIHVDAPSITPIVSLLTGGGIWAQIQPLVSPALPDGATSGYWTESDGSLDIYTLVPGTFGFLHDITAPGTPAELSGRLVHGALALTWQPADDNSGAVERYLITRGGKPIVSAKATRVTIRAADLRNWSVFRVSAIDPSGNQSRPSHAVKLRPKARPRSLPRVIPAWAQSLHNWQSSGRKKPRPQAPKPVPSWYWRWAAWHMHRFEIA